MKYVDTRSGARNGCMIVQDKPVKDNTVFCPLCGNRNLICDSVVPFHVECTPWDALAEFKVKCITDGCGFKGTVKFKGHWDVGIVEGSNDTDDDDKARCAVVEVGTVNAYALYSQMERGSFRCGWYPSRGIASTTALPSEPTRS